MSGSGLLAISGVDEPESVSGESGGIGAMGFGPGTVGNVRSVDVGDCADWAVGV